MSKPDESEGLNRIWASAGAAAVEDPDVTTPGKYSDGWEGEIPLADHANFILRFLTDFAEHVNKTGVPTYDAETVYPDEAIVSHDLGAITDNLNNSLGRVLFKNVSGGTLQNSTPSLSNVNWERVVPPAFRQAKSNSVRQATNTTLQDLNGGQGSMTLAEDYITKVTGFYSFENASATGLRFVIDFGAGNTFTGVVKLNVGNSTATRLVTAIGGSQTIDVTFNTADISTSLGGNHLELDGHVNTDGGSVSVAPQFAIGDGSGTLTCRYGTIEAHTVQTIANYLEI